MLSSSRGIILLVILLSLITKAKKATSSDAENDDGTNP